MKFQKQKDPKEKLSVKDALETLCSSAEANDCGKKRRHGKLLPESIRCVICGPSNCGKTNLMFALLTDPNGLKFENLYVFSKTLFQPKYMLLGKIMENIPEIGYFKFDKSEDIVKPEEAKRNSVFLFDDVACDSQEHMRAYFSTGRHMNVDSFYLTQTYTRVPKHLLRDNLNLIVLFKQDDLNLKHVHSEHVTTDMSFNKFKELCTRCWKDSTHSFVVIDKERELNQGRYKCGFNTIITDI
jgi:hypothetical protein